ncbi:MAG: Cytochrome bd terminal oxidase subunit II [uncultured Rubrobacteraceae bacterium]|uniref:Cytochrome bd terminal oxidase subunit II n=1 Tax=uncultured Rubrobacteraceae bacterium TaxID=349277 RepID=A0A6J4R4T2_9ACTN|nr:MAG: Cytochrome bd terminal oxidase subunit II [uncultured Rubrobacteraceae bacterium]
METLWFVLVAFMLTMYVLLDGFDLGAGAIHPFLARDDREKRIILRSIGPVWDGNEVWIIAAGGTLFFAFPQLYASGFSGFYLPLMIVLWLLMIRGLSIELRGHFDNPLWASFWDAAFFVGSALLAIFFGAALGNVVRGVPMGEDNYFFQPLWTNFSPTNPEPGILDWYTILTGLLALAVLVVHGASWVALKTESGLNERARRFARFGWAATVVLTALTTLATFYLRPEMLSAFAERPWGAVLPVLALAGLAGVGYFHLRGRDRAAFLSSGAYIVGMMTSTVFAIYPNVLPAVNPENSLTVFNASASQYGMSVGLIWWSIGMLLAATYFVLIYRLFRGKVRLEDEGY